MTGAQSPSLPEFLSARLDEDEAVAKDAAEYVGSETWSVNEYPYEGIAFQPERSAGGDDSAPDCQHAMRYSPARVLADVEAKRRLLSDETLTYGERANGEPSLFHWRVLHYMVQPYRDHPDFDEAWAL